MNLQPLRDFFSKTNRYFKNDDEMLKVTSLQLNGKGITSLPIEMKYLTNLMRINICNNPINEIPDIFMEMNGLIDVNFSNTNIKILPISLFNSTLIKYLDISGTNITVLPLEFENLQNLERLSMTNTPVSKILPSQLSLKKLLHLDLRGTKLENVDKIIAGLESIESIDISNTNIKSFPIGICRLQNIVKLFLCQTSIQYLPAEIKLLSSLYILDLSDSLLSFLPNEIGQLKNLEELYLTNTQLSELPESLFDLSNLETLTISNTKLKELPSDIYRLCKLKHLCISKTNILQLPRSIGALKNLTYLDLSENTLVTIPKELLELNLPFYENTLYFGCNIHHVNFLDLEVKFFLGSRQSLESYLEKIENDYITLNECKIIFLGNAGAGKTTIIEMLKNNEFVDGRKFTNGIKQDHLSLTALDGLNTTVTAHFWDFGGQEIMQPTHTFFLSTRCLYVVVCDRRKGDNPEMWLELARHYGKGCPTLLIINKIDELIYEEIEVNKLKRKYRDLSLQVVEISCKDNINIDLLKTKIQNIICYTEGYSKRFPKNWYQIKTKLENVNKTYIREEEYIDICEEFSECDLQMQRELLEWLHSLGITFHISSRNSGIHNSIKVLNPEWITNGVYKIVGASIHTNNGFIDKSDLRAIIKNPKYGENKSMVYRTDLECDYILDIMHEFEMSYEYGEKEFIPILAPLDEPFDLEFRKEGLVRFSFEFNGIMPPALFYRLIVKLKEDVDYGYIWRKGVKLVNNSLNAEAIIVCENASLNIYFARGGSNILYLNIIRYTINTLLDELQVTNFNRAFAYNSDNVEIKIMINELLRLLNDGQQEKYSPELRKFVEIQSLLEIFYPKTEVDEMLQSFNKRYSNDDIDNLLNKLDRQYIDVKNLINSVVSHLVDFREVLEGVKDTSINKDEFIDKIDEFKDLFDKNRKNTPVGSINSFIGFISSIITIANDQTIQAYGSSIINALKDLINVIRQMC